MFFKLKSVKYLNKVSTYYRATQHAGKLSLKTVESTKSFSALFIYGSMLTAKSFADRTKQCVKKSGINGLNLDLWSNRLNFRPKDEQAITVCSDNSKPSRALQVGRPYFNACRPVSS